MTHMSTTETDTNALTGVLLLGVRIISVLLREDVG